MDSNEIIKHVRERVYVEVKKRYKKPDLDTRIRDILYEQSESYVKLVRFSNGKRIKKLANPVEFEKFMENRGAKIVKEVIFALNKRRKKKVKFKSQGQMLSYVKEKEQKIIKEVERRAEKEGVSDDNRLLDYKSLVTSILEAEAVYDEDRPVEEKKFPTSQEVDKYLETRFKEYMNSAWKEMFGK